MPRAASGDDALDRRVDALFARWAAGADADGQLDFYGLQTLICREMVEAGEVLLRRRLRRASDRLPVPLQLQVLEADLLDATRTGALGAGRLVQGIEFDAIGRRRAYWLHPEHPGDAHGALRGGLQSRPVPAREIAHVYEKQRTQARGVPWGAPVIRALRDLDDCEVACTACGRCAMDAPGLVTMRDNLPVIDYRRAQKPEAIERCPTGAIVWLQDQGGAKKGSAARPIVRLGVRPEAPT